MWASQTDEELARRCRTPANSLQDRDERRLERHDEQPDDDDEQHVAARELHPANAYAANAATRIGMIVAGIVMNRLLTNASRDPVLVEDVGVVLEA